MLDLTVLELCVLRADQQAIADLEQQLSAMQAAAEAGQPAHDLHRMFHRQMLRAAGNPLIERIGALLLDTFWQIGDTMPMLLKGGGRAIASDEIDSRLSSADPCCDRI